MNITINKMEKLRDYFAGLDKVIKNHSKFHSEFVSVPWMVAGGFIRDVLLDRKPSDVDIIVKDYNSFNLDWKYMDDDGKYDQCDVECVADCGEFGGLPLQFIMRNTAWGVSNTFEYHLLGLSNVAWFEGDLIISGEFIQSAADEKLYINCYDRYNTRDNSDYISKIQKKYPWKVCP